MSLTERMRTWIIKRDEGTSQLRHYSETKGFCKRDPKDCKDCNGQGCGLQVHHIDPRRNGGGDVPDNLLTLLQCEHNGKKTGKKMADPKKEFVVHPDMVEVFENYRKGDKRAFQKMSEERNKKMANGETYWNTDHDQEMLETATERTNNVISLGWIWPKKKNKH